MSRPNQASQTEAELTLSAEELNIVKANLRFALENCPVDGGILTEDGGVSSEESVRSLLERLEAVEKRQISLNDFTKEDIELMKVIAGYAVQECPIEGAMVLDSGRLITRADLEVWKEKIDAFGRETESNNRMLPAIESLEGEHRLILRVVKLLPIVRQKVETGTVDESVLLDIVDFLSTFADACHHAKEEDQLFPALQERGVPSKGCPVGALKLEHQQGRSLVKALSSAIEEYKVGKTEARTAMSAALRDAAEFYANHIWKEDYLLFPMSEKMLSVSDLEVLANDFVDVQAKFGSGFLERYESLVEKLEETAMRAPAPVYATEDFRVPIVNSVQRVR